MAKGKKRILGEEIEIPKGVVATMADGELKIKGAKGEATKKILDPMIKIKIEDNKIIIGGLRNTKKEKKMIGTFKAHINNVIVGCNEPYLYTLKICSGHFPMNVEVKKNELVVKNFFGEKIPRVLKIKEGATVKVEGELITVGGVDKGVCGQVSADIEKLTRRTAYDKRIFQDGIYLIKKNEKEIK